MNEENGMQQEVPVAQPVDQAWRLYGPAAVILHLDLGTFPLNSQWGLYEITGLKPGWSSSEGPQIRCFTC